VTADLAQWRDDERGYALLGVLLALTIIAIMLAGAVPSVQMEVRRDKEDELLFRGQEMARAIARYYNLDRLGTIQLTTPPAYGYLYDLNKLRDGITLGVNELKFVRPSAMKDPMIDKEWEPVRARDPRLMLALQAWAGANNLPIPPSYLILAAPPAKLHMVNPSGGPQQSVAPGSSAVGQQAGAGTGNPQVGIGQQQGIGPQPGVAGFQPGGNQAGKKQPNQNKDADDDDDDDDDAADPLSHLMHSGDNTGLPIVAVAPRLKGKAVHAFVGMTAYEQWVFIYIPTQPLLRPGQTTMPNQGAGNQGGLKVSP